MNERLRAFLRRYRPFWKRPRKLDVGDVVEVITVWSSWKGWAGVIQSEGWDTEDGRTMYWVRIPTAFGQALPQMFGEHELRLMAKGPGGGS